MATVVDTPTNPNPGGALVTRRPQLGATLLAVPAFSAIGWWYIYVFPVSALPIGFTHSPGDAWGAASNELTFGGAVYSHYSPYAESFCQHTPTRDLPYGELVAGYACRIHSGGDGDAWEMALSETFYFDSDPNDPTGLTPADGATVDTNRPTLGLTLAVSDIPSDPVRGEWQLATDAGFTTNVRTVTEAVADHRLSGATTEVVPAAAELFGGPQVWYVRGRAVNDGGAVSGWTSTNDFTVSHPPTTTGHSPTNNAPSEYSGGEFTARWLFSHTSPDLLDAGQTAYQVVVEELDATPVEDTGQVTSATTEALITGIDAGLKGTPLRWKVRVWDDEDVAGPYSDWHPFTLVDAPTVVVVAPTGTVDNPGPDFEWTYTPADGGAQSQFRVSIYESDPNDPVYDSGWQTGTDLEWSVPENAGLVSETDYVARVQVRDALSIEAEDTEAFDTEWTVPAAPDFELEASTFDTHGPVTVLIDALGSADPDFVYWRVYWRASADDAPELVNGDISLGDWVVRASHYRALPNRAQEYAVVQVASRFGILVESDYEWQSITPVGRAFWLIADDELAIGGDTEEDVPIADLAATAGMRLRQVESHPNQPNVERAELPIIDRGMKVEVGTDYGTTGSITVHLTDDDDSTAAEQQELIESLLTEAVTLRRPSGQVGEVNVHELAFEPQGRDDWIIATVPYTEVAE